MAKHKWVLLQDVKTIGNKEWSRYIQQSYDLVKSRLPKKTQAQLATIPLKRKKK